MEIKQSGWQEPQWLLEKEEIIVPWLQLYRVSAGMQIKGM